MGMQIQAESRWFVIDSSGFYASKQNKTFLLFHHVNNLQEKPSIGHFVKFCVVAWILFLDRTCLPVTYNIILQKWRFFLDKDQKKTPINMLFAIVIFCQPQTFEMKKWQNMNHFILLYQVSWHQISILDWDIKFYYFRDEDSKLT